MSPRIKCKIPTDSQNGRTKKIIQTSLQFFNTQIVIFLFSLAARLKYYDNEVFIKDKVKNTCVLNHAACLCDRWTDLGS